MVEFPDDLISCILSRLPVKSILRFRCLSKNWCALIATKSFIKQNLNHSIKTKSNQNLILHQHDIYSLYSVGLCSLTNKAQALNLDLPINPNHHVIKILGSCNGFLCLSVFDGSGGSVVIWNPTTRKHVKLPVVNVQNPFTCPGGHIDVMQGFGYDSVSDDYRVLTLVQFFDAKDPVFFLSEANVYSVRSNSWRKIRDFPNARVSIKQENSVLACGALHWLVTERELEFGIGMWSTASFDLVTENCRIFTHPDFVDHGLLSLHLAELGGRLTIVCNYFEVGIVHVWVMKAYGVKDSWTRILDVGSEMIKPVEFFMPLAYSENGDEVLLNLNFVKLIWYNMEKRTAKPVDVRGFPQPFNAVICLESLVSLGGKAENDKKQGKEKKGAKKKWEEEDFIWSKRIGEANAHLGICEKFGSLRPDE